MAGPPSILHEHSRCSPWEHACVRARMRRSPSPTTDVPSSIHVHEHDRHRVGEHACVRARMRRSP
eukprot:12222866-Alexandrium_andersonii.AAC.1